jgi:Fe-S-cluster containining protein
MASCDQCGACCKGPLILEADELDLSREPGFIFADPHYAGHAPDEVVRRLQDEAGCWVIVACGARCPFLADNRCSIYPTRPNACVELQAGDEQCQAARREEGIPPLPFRDG